MNDWVHLSWGLPKTINAVAKADQYWPLAHLQGFNFPLYCWEQPVILLIYTSRRHGWVHVKTRMPDTWGSSCSIMGSIACSIVPSTLTPGRVDARMAELILNTNWGGKSDIMLPRTQEHHARWEVEGSDTTESIGFRQSKLSNSVAFKIQYIYGTLDSEFEMYPDLPVPYNFFLKRDKSLKCCCNWSSLAHGCNEPTLEPTDVRSGPVRAIHLVIYFN